MSDLDVSADPDSLLDHRTVAWNTVRRSRYWMYQCFQYRYPGRIRELRQRLMVIPQEQYGDQRVCHFELGVSMQANGPA